MNNFSMLTGNVGKDPETRFTPSGSKVVNYSLAVFRPTKDKENPATDWFNVICWGDQATLIEQNVHKGTRLLVEGRFQTRSYDDKDGKKVYVTELIQNDFWLAPKKLEEQKEEQDKNEFVEPITDDDLPF